MRSPKRTLYDREYVRKGSREGKEKKRKETHAHVDCWAVSRHPQSDHHHPPPLLRRLNRRIESSLRPRTINRNTNSSTALLLHRLDNIRRQRIEGLIRSTITRDRSTGFVRLRDVDGGGTEGFEDFDDGCSDGAGADYEGRLAGLE